MSDNPRRYFIQRRDNTFLIWVTARRISDPTIATATFAVHTTRKNVARVLWDLRQAPGVTIERTKVL